MTRLAGADLVRVCGAAGTFDPAKSDGCTLAPDGWWRDACVKHDEKYFYGGSAADRLAADKGLRDDMLKAGAPSAVANLYYYAVRVGGAPGTGLPWQWGFGQGK